MTDNSRKAQLRQTMETDHAACLAILSRVRDEQWATPVPSEEGAQWTARDVLAHMAGAEAGQLGQIQRAVAGGVTVPEDFDVNRYNRRAVQKAAGVSVADHLTTIERDYRAVLAELDKVTDSDLDKTGRHARGDTLTVEQFFRRITEHRRQHAEALAQVLGL
ncbi:MAG: maleylpyruvate isomerase N-terminal domain-containing protein [Anaerolineales bacterium]|nr:maleylpyruvate isomerase N-terminal domain-containing protein [Anaerolineales bacterium]